MTSAFITKNIVVLYILRFHHKFCSRDHQHVIFEYTASPYVFPINNSHMFEKLNFSFQNVALISNGLSEKRQERY